MKQYVIAAFYKFIPLDDYESMKIPMLAAMKENNILGTIILAHEGINGGFAGHAADMAHFYAFMHEEPRFADLVFKETYSDMMPYEKAKVKFRKEIVTLGVPDLSPLQETGTRVEPAEWNELISDPEVVVVDTRNSYEVELGTFKHAIDPQTENFRDFPAYVQQHLLDKKDKKIAMFCTGGIRCEKSTAYLKSLGFDDVYQLEGGVLNYIKTIPAEESLWEGSCFVFDERIAVQSS
ncbi:MAG: rhodanese-related sulfurtransferase [Legionellaceae bacterium]|nr:rhodanese-related sulfurtransferase [Legionellaceae bacterium]